MKKLAVVAFGGNALLKGDQKGTIEEQESNAYDTCVKLSYLIKKDYNLVYNVRTPEEAMVIVEDAYKHFKKGGKNFCLNYKKYKLK